jgi:hypothetical protein
MATSPQVYFADEQEDEQRRVAREPEVADTTDDGEEAQDPVVADVVDPLTDALSERGLGGAVQGTRLWRSEPEPPQAHR